MLGAGAFPKVEVSVILPTFQGHDRIPECLTSLVQQTLAPDRFEIVIVQNGPESETRGIVRDFIAAHPDHQFRYLEKRPAGAGRARNIAFTAARGEYFTCVDDDDQVGPHFLEALLSAARPGVLPLALVGDIHDEGNAAMSFDNYYSSVLQRYAEGDLSVQRLDLINAAVSLNAAKLAPTALGRAIGYNDSLRSGEDVAFWFEYFARYGFEPDVVLDSDAAYIRTVRDESVGRQQMDFDFAVDQRLDCIAALRTVRKPSQETIILGNRLVQSQSVWINKYLTQVPTDHHRMVAAAHARDLYDLPWRVINKDLGRDLALLYCFPPYLDTSGLVAARRLMARGDITDVISQDLSSIRTTDPKSRVIAGPVVDRLHVVEGRASFVNWNGITSYAEESLATVAEWEAEKGPYRSVYSRAMAVASHFPAAVLKLRQPEIRWTAEMSDPLLVNMDGVHRDGQMLDGWLRDELRAGLAQHGFPQPEDANELFEWAELVAYALADEIVFTNELQRKVMLDYCRDRGLADRAWQISRTEGHPTPPEALYSVTDSKRELDAGVVNLGYFGVFYPNRGLPEVSSALANLSAAERMKVRFHVFTADPDTVALEVLRARLSDVIQVHPYVPYLEFLNLAVKFDALVVNDAITTKGHEINPYLPSKVSDYRGSGTPIWAVYEPGSVLSTMPSEFGSRVGDAHGALLELRRIIADLSPEVAQ